MAKSRRNNYSIKQKLFIENISRVAGVFFVSAGSLFALTSTSDLVVNQLAYSTGDVKQQAEVIMSDEPTAPDSPERDSEAVVQAEDNVHESRLETSFTDEAVTQNTNAIFDAHIENNTNATANYDSTPNKSLHHNYDDVDIEPPINIRFDKDRTSLSGWVEIGVAVKAAGLVEMFAVRQSSLVERYIGTASKVAQGQWKFKWNTKNVPNGNYKIFAIVKNKYGKYKSNSQTATIQNDVFVERTENESSLIDTLEASKDSIKAVEEEVRVDTTRNVIIPVSDIIPHASQEIVDQNQSTGIVEVAPVPEEHMAPTGVVHDAELAGKVFAGLENALDMELDKLSVALRTGDTFAVHRIENRLRLLENSAVDYYVDGINAKGETADVIREQMRTKISRIIETEKQNIVKTDTIIKQRVGEEVFKDSDSDGISDYDEVNLYDTDPFTADSDGDGFIDGTEILDGFNPNDATREAAIVFEDPKTDGPIREDILTVDTVSAISTIQNVESSVPIAKIEGKGLPNSFVTLYIFSTPIVVTVKTDSEGSWVYEFDKELEDGEHEIYVGITDNAGKIIAKSRPLLFVKEAQAITTLTENTVATPAVVQEPPRDPNLVSENMFLLLMSLGVVAIGLILLIIGMYVRHERVMEFSHG